MLIKYKPDVQIYKRRLLFAIAFVILLVSFVESSAPQIMIWPEAQMHDVSTCHKNSTLALTFDDGPSTYTPVSFITTECFNTDFLQDLLKTLKKLQIKATFFMLGREVLKYPEIVKQVFEDGHQIAVHTYGHINLQTSSQNIIMAEMNSAAEAIADIIGLYPTYMRPPYGGVGPREYFLMKRLGFEMALWDLDTKDWDHGTDPYIGFHSLLWPEESKEVVSIAGKTFLRTKLRGYMSLQHDIHQHSVKPEKIEQIYNIARERGFFFATVSECAPDPTIPAYRSRMGLSPIQRLKFADKIDADRVKAISMGKEVDYRGPIKFPETTEEEKNEVQNEIYVAAKLDWKKQRNREDAEFDGAFQKKVNAKKPHENIISKENLKSMSDWDLRFLWIVIVLLVLLLGGL
ncbi:chitin deacetylase, partial [Nowakowskiella sp. JEL0078]